MRLPKSLYGLSDYPMNWWNTIDPYLVEIGFEPCKSDTRVYIYTSKKGVIIIPALYIDDLLLLHGDTALLEMIKKKLMSTFKMTDMGNVSLVLGMQFTRDREKGILTITRKDYTKFMLEKFGMSACTPLSTPGLGPELSLEKPEGKTLDEEGKKRYQEITGSVMYLTQVTRYDIMYATTQLARATSKASKAHMAAANHLLSYLVGMSDFSTVYKRGGFKLTALSDAYWGNNPDNGKSMSPYIMMMASTPVSFKAGLQTLTAMSTMGAELVSATLAIKETMLCSNMMEMGFNENFNTVPLFIDNTSTLFVVGNRTYSARTKHMALRSFYIRELVNEGRISIHHAPTQDQHADIGTTHRNKQRHRELINKTKDFGA